MIKIKYSKERLQNSLRMSMFFFTIGMTLLALSFITPVWKEISITSIGITQILTAVPMFIIYLFENKKQYLTIKNGDLIKHGLFPKKINLGDVHAISEFAGDLKLLIDNSEFVIDTQIIEPNSLIRLKSELKNYNLK
ncbi:MAG: hypothetical protein KBT58_04815 [Bizionia sp.]|nr:hypothetical protein [Bizionia sp.]